MTQYNPFHLAFPIRDIEETREFYQNLLGCEIGRSTDKWIDFNFFGHQLSAHVKPEELQQAKSNEVDGKNVPVRHFGAILEWEAWQELADKLKAYGIDFIIEPYIRFEGEVGEQATMFFLDPSGNALEFKAFQDREQIFAK
ncbi:VOC family protein [Litoribacter populi]|uniref:VOC family protein n=1 Tax=Litoribacter populi TaxID=2598460 RepID=UPI00117BFBE1|nr:VOC family protein [Litoribacter populi]